MPIPKHTEEEIMRDSDEIADHEVLYSDEKMCRECDGVGMYLIAGEMVNCPVCNGRGFLFE